MKLKFSHFNLVYPLADSVTIEMEPETDFEAGYLKALSKRNQATTLEFVRDGDGKANFLCLQVKFGLAPEGKLPT